MGSGRTGAARSATSASVASMASVAKMCVLIYLRVFAWLISAEHIYICVYRIPYINLFCLEARELSAQGKRRRGRHLSSLLYSAITENRCRRGIE